jgi:hypothetical protein
MNQFGRGDCFKCVPSEDNEKCSAYFAVNIETVTFEESCDTIKDMDAKKWDTSRTEVDECTIALKRIATKYGAFHMESQISEFREKLLDIIFRAEGLGD